MHIQSCMVMWSYQDMAYGQLHNIHGKFKMINTRIYVLGFIFNCIIFDYNYLIV